MAKAQKTKPKSKENLNLNQHSTVRTDHVRAYHCAQLPYTIQHRTVLIIFTLILQTIIVAQMLSILEGREGLIVQKIQIKIYIQRQIR